MADPSVKVRLNTYKDFMNTLIIGPLSTRLRVPICQDSPAIPTLLSWQAALIDTSAGPGPGGLCLGPGLGHRKHPAYFDFSTACRSKFEGKPPSAITF